MIKSLVLKDFHDLQQNGKRFTTGSAHFTTDLKRAEDLVTKGFIRILEIEKAKTEEAPKKKSKRKSKKE